MPSNGSQGSVPANQFRRSVNLFCNQKVPFPYRRSPCLKLMFRRSAFKCSNVTPKAGSVKWIFVLCFLSGAWEWFLTFSCFRLSSLILWWTNCAECVTSQQQDSTSEPSHARAARVSLGGPATISQSLRSARTITDVSWTRRTGPRVKPADSENVWWWGCPSLDQDMAEDPTGSRSIVWCRPTPTRPGLRPWPLLSLQWPPWPLWPKRTSCLPPWDGLTDCPCPLSLSLLLTRQSPPLSPTPTCSSKRRLPSRRLTRRSLTSSVSRGRPRLPPKCPPRLSTSPQSRTHPPNLVTVFSRQRRTGTMSWRSTRTVPLEASLAQDQLTPCSHLVSLVSLNLSCLICTILYPSPLLSTDLGKCSNQCKAIFWS